MTHQPKKCCVISHERSGTHFLMNTLALNFGYVVKPWWNLDYETGLNFHAPAALKRYLGQADGRVVRNILKSHHHVEFFRPILGYLTDQFHVFYVYRDPRAVMCSFWRMIKGLQWDEGPVTASAGEFMRAAPRGALLRYQKHQAPTMLARWADHVSGWLDVAEQEAPVTLVRYEDLNDGFDDAVTRLGRALGQAVFAPRRPGLTENVVAPGHGQSRGYADLLSIDDLTYVDASVGGLLERLNYRREHGDQAGASSGSRSVG